MHIECSRTTRHKRNGFPVDLLSDSSDDPFKVVITFSHGVGEP